MSTLDPAVRPQDDFYGYVNGVWTRNTEIPADKGRCGSGGIGSLLGVQKMRAKWRVGIWCMCRRYWKRCVRKCSAWRGA